MGRLSKRALFFLLTCLVALALARAFPNPLSTQATTFLGNTVGNRIPKFHARRSRPQRLFNKTESPPPDEPVLNRQKRNSLLLTLYALGTLALNDLPL